MKKQNGFIKMLLIIIAVIVVAVFVYIRMGSKTEIVPSNITNNETNNSLQGGEKDLTADWKTFTIYGFEFKYPSEWIAVDLEMRYAFTLTDDALLFTTPGRISPKDSITMGFSLMDNSKNNYTIDSLAACSNPEDSEERFISECEDVLINGVSYKKFISKGSASEVGGVPIVLDQKYVTVVTVHDNKSFVVSAKINDERLLDENVILSKFDSILKTFKFTK